MDMPGTGRDTSGTRTWTCDGQGHGHTRDKETPGTWHGRVMGKDVPGTRTGTHDGHGLGHTRDKDTPGTWTCGGQGHGHTRDKLMHPQGTGTHQRHGHRPARDKSLDPQGTRTPQVQGWGPPAPGGNTWGARAALGGQEAGGSRPRVPGGPWLASPRSLLAAAGTRAPAVPTPGVTPQ